MRVIAGSARRLLLETPAGKETRPTTDRIKETLFNILQPYLYDCSFLDLFSGSGGIGIEALSRGAAAAVFVDKARESIRCIENNLQTTDFTEEGEVLPMDVLQGLRNLERRQKYFDVVFMDPPYDKGLEIQVLEFLQKSNIIDDNSTIIVETSLKTGIDYMNDLHYHITRVKEYKTNKHIFLNREKQ